jgi:hypothetical protein
VHSLVPVSNEFPKGTPAFMTIEAPRAITDRAHSLKDVFISWSLLCSTVAFSDFFESAVMAWEVLMPRQELGRHRHSDPGYYRLVERRHGSSLSRSRGPNHCGPNPAWDDGMALKAMWKDILARALPDNAWHKNPIGNTVLREADSLHATCKRQRLRLAPARF